MKRLLPILILAIAATSGAQSPKLPDLKNTKMEISWEDFKALVESISPTPTPVPPPPTPAFISSAGYRGRLEGQVLRLDGELSIEALASGWVHLPMWQQGAVLSFDGPGTLLSRRPEGQEILVQGPGRRTLRVSLAIAVPDNPGENRLNLVLPDAPVNLVEIRPGAEIEDLQAHGGIVVPGTKGSTLVSLSGGRTTLTWKRPFKSEPSAGGEVIKLKPRIHLESWEILDLADGALSGTMVLDLQVRLAKISAFDLEVPDGVEVFDVSSAGLESWKILRRDGDRILHLGFAAPQEGAIRATLRFESAYDPSNGDVKAPRFEPEEIERENGWLTVGSEGAEVSLDLPEGVLPSDPSELPPDIQSMASNPVAACRFTGSPGEIRVKIREHQDAAVLTAVIESLNATSLMLADGTEALWLDLKIRNNRKQFLKLRLADEDTEIWSFLADSQPARPKRSKDTILLPLPRGGSEKISTLSLVLLHHGKAMRVFRLVQPSLPIFDIPVIEAAWTVFLPPDHSYSLGHCAFSLVSESNPLVRRLKAPSTVLGLSGKGLQSSDAALSKSIMRDQNAQEDKIMQELKQPRKALRRGALPVRISLPSGVGQLPKIRVARVLMVNDEGVVLPIRVFPKSWASMLVFLNYAFLFGAGLLAALRFHRRFLSAAAAFLLALAIPGGPGIGGSFVLTAFVAFSLWVLLRVRSWFLGRRRRREVVQGNPADPENDIPTEIP